MAIILDLILLALTIFVASYIGLYFLPLGLPLRILTCSMIAILCVSIVKRALFKPRDEKISYRKFVTYLIWQGEDYTKQLICKLCDENRSCQDMGEFLIIDGVGVFLWTKYGSISADTLVKFYRICKKNNLIKAYIITTNGDKKTSAFVKSFGDVTLTYENFKTIYKNLKKRDMLPDNTKNRIPPKQLFSMIIQTAFTRKNGFRFIGVSLLLLAISFFTPFSTYYILLSGVNLALAVACLVVSLKKE